MSGKPINHATRHKPVPSRTLMRHAVKKPAGQARHLKAQGHLDHVAKQFLGQIEQHTSVKQLDQKRLQRAKQIRRSRAISRFPQLSPAFKPLVKAVPATPQRSVPKNIAIKPQTTAELLERALQQAVSHEQPPVKTKRRRIKKSRAAAISAIALAVILTTAITGQNSATSRLQTASAAAGFTASLPAYQPAGFKPNQIEADKGVVAIGFSSRDHHSFSITQKPTEWDDNQLLVSFVSGQDPHFQKVNTGQQTLFLYGQHNATWISHGIWYDVHTFGSLDDHQLINLATSS